MLDTPNETSAHAANARSRLRRDWLIALVLCVVVLVAAGGVVWWNNISFPATGHSHGAVSAELGQPGDPNLPARIVDVAMVEGDGAMKFEPSEIEVTKGDQVRFRITNNGLLDHEFVLATLIGNLQHLEEMKRMPNMVHGGPNSITLGPNASGEILWRFSQAGSFDFSCLIPGHREAGMHGAIFVKQ
jgi:uncharacterized cupredoxin-like copper-binding protein